MASMNYATVLPTRPGASSPKYQESLPLAQGSGDGSPPVGSGGHSFILY